MKTNPMPSFLASLSESRSSNKPCEPVSGTVACFGGLQEYPDGSFWLFCCRKWSAVRRVLFLAVFLLISPSAYAVDNPEICYPCCAGSKLPEGRACCYYGDWENPSEASYNPKTQVCCQNGPGTGDSCCDGNAYNSRSKICCQGNIVEGDSCCGGKGYDWEMEGCCSHGDWENPSYTVYPLDGHVCCSDGPGEGNTCCGGQAYASDTHWCCSYGNPLTYTILAKEDGNGCCGGQPYNVETHGCCVGGSWENPTYAIYHLTAERCCQGNVGAGNACCGEEAYYWDSHACCYNDDWENPSWTVYDREGNTCCQGNVVSGNTCCASQGYDYNTHVCCNGKVRAGNACCGDQGYDWNTHGCCNGTIYVLDGHACCTNGPGLGNACCAGVSYDTLIHVCCSANGPSVGNTCCEDQGYNNETYGCCDGTVYLLAGHVCCGDGPGVGDSCCDGRAYNSDTHCCSNGVILNKATEDCGATPCDGPPEADEGEVRVSGERVTATGVHPVRGEVVTMASGWWLIPLRSVDVSGQISATEAPLHLGIVTIDTPESRSLWGNLSVNMVQGDPSIADVYNVDQQIFFPWTSEIEIPGHAGCGVHDWHNRDLPLAFLPKETGKWVLKASLNPFDGYALKDVEINVVFDYGLLADYNRDGKIDEEDADRYDTMGAMDDRSTFHFWINDNQEISESSGNDIPGADTPDHSTGSVNTVRDLVDFFPISIELREFLNAVPDPENVELLLRAPALNRVVYPDSFVGISPQNSRQYLVDPSVASVLGNAQTQHLSGWTALTAEDIARIKLGQSIFLFEGRAAGNANLELRVRYNDGLAGEFKLPIRISPVEQMFRHKNLLWWGGGEPAGGVGDRLDEPTGFPDWEVGEKNLVFVHGYNVNPQAARGWNSAMFRRLYWSGINARFYGVTWHGSETQTSLFGDVTPNYHVNVVNALHTAEGLADFLVSELSDPTVVAAHSLGNMVVSSAIADYSGVNPDAYFMINAAVPVETYDQTADPEPDMVHRIWRKNSFQERLWASEWHTKFGGSDNRSALTWRGRFGNLGNTTVWNFHSSGDEVFDPYTGRVNGTLGYIGKSIFQSVFGVFPDGRHAWPMQELFKGRNRFTDEILGSTYGGWGLSRNWEVWVERSRFPNDRRITRMARKGWETEDPPLEDAVLQTQPFFRDNYVPNLYDPIVGSSFVNSIDENGRHWQIRLIAQMIPAQTYAAGRYSIESARFSNIDMNTMHQVPGVWPNRPKSGEDWLHSDVRNVAYLYTYKMFDDWLELGKIKK